MLELLRDYASYIFIAVLAVVWFLMRTKGARVTPDASLGGLIGNGRPAVLEFFSNT